MTGKRAPLIWTFVEWTVSVIQEGASKMRSSQGQKDVSCPRLSFRGCIMTAQDASAEAGGQNPSRQLDRVGMNLLVFDAWQPYNRKPSSQSMALDSRVDVVAQDNAKAAESVVHQSSLQCLKLTM